MVQANLRKPVVAGQFYPSSAKDIKKVISSFADKAALKRDAYGCILPHAGYIYSGNVAVQTVSRVNIKDTLILLGPNHTGLGATFSIMSQGTWETPLGNVEIDTLLANLFLNKSSYLRNDLLAHLEEHSLEVELPILQYFRSDFKIVPIAIKTDNLPILTEVAEDLASVISQNNLSSSVMFVASSDLTHYEPLESVERKDALAIEAIIALDELKLERVVKDSEISMCGFAPVTVLIKAAKLLGGKKGRVNKISN